MRDYDGIAYALRGHTHDTAGDACSKCPIEMHGEYDETCFTRLVLEAADAIEELVAAVPHWISVEERLPDEDMEVLISYRYKEGEGDTNHVNIDITTYGQMYFGGREMEGVKHWRPPFEYFSSNYEVVAWMPLPAPPKEDAK